jgi:class 3 adenylate cyclase
MQAGSPVSRDQRARAGYVLDALSRSWANRPMNPEMVLGITRPPLAREHEEGPKPEVGGRTMRDLAVMFVDIVGSTGLYESLGDARAHQLVAATLQLMTVAVQTCGGCVVKTVGDELLCTYPSADGAALGGIAIQKALIGLQVPNAERLAVRIGINFGPVVEAKGDVFGDSVNVAARLVRMARPQQILTTASCVERLSPAHRSEARELQLIGVRGRSNYVPVWELPWRLDEQPTQRILLPARKVREGSLLRLEFRGRGWEIWREGDVLTIGRDDSSHVRLEGELASRYHARIVVSNGKFILIDQSTNGTYVLPEGGETAALMREEYVLSGRGEISFGCIAANAGSELVRYARRARPVPVGAGNGAKVPAARAGST